MDWREARRKYWIGMTREEFVRVCTVQDASAIVRTAVIWGVLRQEPCLVCGARAGAHHHNYALPLDVLWLCQSHHMDEHRRLGVGAEHRGMAFGNIGISPDLRDILAGRTKSECAGV